MKTPLQQTLDFVKEEVQLFGSARQILISKLNEMIEEEKNHAVYFAFKFRHEDFTLKQIKKEYDAIYNGKSE